MLDAWEKILSEGEHCNKMALAETILSNPNAMPVSKELYQQLSFLVNKHVAIGTDPQAQTLSQLCANAYISRPAESESMLVGRELRHASGGVQERTRRRPKLRHDRCRGAVSLWLGDLRRVP